MARAEFEQRALDKVHDALVYTVAAASDYEAYRGACEVGRGSRATRHRDNAVRNATSALREVDGFISVATSREPQWEIAPADWLTLEEPSKFRTLEAAIGAASTVMARYFPGFAVRGERQDRDGNPTTWVFSELGGLGPCTLTVRRIRRCSTRGSRKRSGQ